MMAIKPQRRQFLTQVAGGLLASCLSPASAMGNTNRAGSTSGLPGLLYSASTRTEGTEQYFLSALELASGHYQEQLLPFRGHAVLPLPENKSDLPDLSAQRVLLFGRRPGTESARVSFLTQTTQETRATGTCEYFQCATGKHFNGHGYLSARGDALFTTENDYANARGVLSIRDPVSLDILGEYSSYGLDPHDIHCLSDGKTLVVANGGIRTHPDFGRRKLNIDSMQPSLVYIDAANGQKIDEYRLPDHQLSIRHLSVSPDDSVAAALQYEGDLYRRPPASLVAWQAAGGELKLLDSDPLAISSSLGYMADLAYAPSQQILAVTSPRGNTVSVWTTATGGTPGTNTGQRWLHNYPLPEPSGIRFLAAENCFLVSCNNGALYTLPARQQAVSPTLVRQLPHTHWDNHLVLV